MVTKWRASGLVNEGRARALGAALTATARSIAEGRTRPAARQLGAFLIQLGSLVKAGILSTVDVGLPIKCALEAVEQLAQAH